MSELTKKIDKWAEKATKTRRKLEDEAYDLTSELIKEFGEDKGDNIVINVEENDFSLYVMEYDGYDGGYIGRNITSIELSKKYGGISLIYGEDDYEYIKYGDTLLSDRLYILRELLGLEEK